MDGWHFVYLVTVLRHVMPLSTQDLLEGVTALDRYPFLSEKHVLRVTFVHRPQDEAAFELVWHLVFTPNLSERQERDISGKSPGEASAPGGLGLGQGFGGFSLSSGQARRPTHADVHALLAGLSPIPSERTFEETIRQLMGQAEAYTWLNSQELSFQRGQVGIDDWEEARNYVESLAERLRQELKMWQVKQDNSWESLRRQSWQYKPLLSLTAAEKALVQAAIRQWGRKLAERPGWRYHSARHGIPDLQATLREACRNDGRAFYLHYRRRTPRIPELVVLCDVSNSVSPYVEFLLFLVGRLRVNFRRVRVFFFIDTLWDVSEERWSGDLQDLSQAIQVWSGKASSGFSDYGQVLQEMATFVLPEISSRATLLIIGDARNNFRPTQSEYLAEIQQKVRNILWLNPLSQEEWLERDNVMSAYGPYCSAVYRCQTVEDLHFIAKRLLR